MRIYLASPYTAYGCNAHNAPRVAQQNVDRAIEMANKIIEKGHYVFVPHLSHYLHIHYSSKKDLGDFWYDFDNSFIFFWAEALFYLDGSPGADAELELAQQLGLKIFYRLEDVPDASEG